MRARDEDSSNLLLDALALSPLHLCLHRFHLVERAVFAGRDGDAGDADLACCVEVGNKAIVPWPTYMEISAHVQVQPVAPSHSRRKQPSVVGIRDDCRNMLNHGREAVRSRDVLRLDRKDGLEVG